MDIFDRLKAAAAADWQSYVDHYFVRQLGAGTLPHAAFRTYLVQDYLFLIQFARAYALATYKSRTLADMRAAQAGLAAILDEMDLHVRLCGRWALSPEDIEAAPEHQATVAYLALVREARPAGLAEASWRNWYGYFPWEDWRSGRTAILDVIERRLRAWAKAGGTDAVRRLRRERVEATFGIRRTRLERGACAGALRASVRSKAPAGGLARLGRGSAA